MDKMYYPLSKWKESKGREKLFASPYDGAETILIVPPVAWLDRPSLSAHILQGSAGGKEKVSVFYACLAFAAWTGEVVNNSFACLSPRYLLSERLFAAKAYGGVPLLGKNAGEVYRRMIADHFLGEGGYPLSLEALAFLAREISAWVDDLARFLVSRQPKVVACSTNFEQTAASVAILKAVKTLAPRIVTVIGGANCAGDMAEGVASLDPAIDYVFSGESDTAFPDFLKRISEGGPGSDRLIKGSPCLKLDDIPTPDYKEFYEQLCYFLDPEPRDLSIPFESSRGCWWGEKTPCTFCGLNNDFLKYRQKSPERLVDELKELVTSFPSKTLVAYDSIMPDSYYTDLLPAIKDLFPGVQIFYEQKSNISLDKMRRLKEAKIDIIQPGIEAITTSLLNRMQKGVTGCQNIAMMRYARACGVALNWNLLCGFPQDTLEEYEETLRYMPLLRHLNPPAILCPLNIDRFSRYYSDPGTYGLGNLKPLATYADVLPEHVDPAKIAYRFTCEYESAYFGQTGVFKQLELEIAKWRACWVPQEEVDAPRMMRPPADESRLPSFHVTRLKEGEYLLTDTRGLAGTRERSPLNEEQATAVLVSWPLREIPLSAACRRWAGDVKGAIEMDGYHVPLATAEPAFLQSFLDKKKQMGKESIHER